MAGILILFVAQIEVTIQMRCDSQQWDAREIGRAQSGRRVIGYDSVLCTLLILSIPYPGLLVLVDGFIDGFIDGFFFLKCPRGTTDHKYDLHSSFANTHVPHLPSSPLLDKSVDTPRTALWERQRSHTRAPSSLPYATGA